MDSSVVELLRYDRTGGKSDSHAHQDPDTKGSGTATQVVNETSSLDFTSSQEPQRTRRRANRHGIAIYTALCLSVLPVTLLLGFSPKVSTGLAYNGCTTNGDFALPYSASIWSAKYFFAITIPFSGPAWRSCSYSSYQSSASACDGYSYTEVKVIDLAWDLLVGRGGQLVFAWLAYHVFRAVVANLMEEGEVGYDLFACVAFHSGSVPALLTTLRHTFGWAPVPRTRRAMWYCLAMAMVTLYIAIMPTLLSAMTGYTSLYFPYLINISSSVSDSTVDCQGMFAPAYGRVVMPNGYSRESFLLPYDHPPDSENSAPWVDCEYSRASQPTSLHVPMLTTTDHERYQDIYAQCPNPLNLTDCPAANISTRIDRMTYVSNYLGCDRSVCDSNEPVTLPPPLPGFQTWPMGKDRAYTHWLCSYYEVFVPWQGQDPQTRMNGNILGMNDTEDIFAPICRSGSKYAWGFSFLLSLLTAVLNLVAVAIMCALWVSVRGVQIEQGTLKDAFVMVSQAKQHFGEKVGQWSAKTLREKVEMGKVGMTTNEGLRRRDRQSFEDDGQHSYGDTNAGDWGGAVEIRH